MPASPCEHLHTALLIMWKQLPDIEHLNDIGTQDRAKLLEINLSVMLQAFGVNVWVVLHGVNYTGTIFARY